MTQRDSIFKNSFKSIGYNMTFGWNSSEKTIRKSSLWMLGKCYRQSAHTEADCKNMGEFKNDYTSRIWITYRREFPVISDSHYTSDVGWGCMIRSGQMIVAQALITHFLGQDWKWDYNLQMIHPSQLTGEVNHDKIISYFLDELGDKYPFSIHSIIKHGNKKPGEWYGPHSVAFALKKAMEEAGKNNDELSYLSIYVAQDCTVYSQDVLSVLGGNKSVIMLVPLRLGTNRLIKIYEPQIMYFFTMESCIGIIGGRPNHAVYFLGYQDNKLFYLDPHYCQLAFNLWTMHFPLWTYHCKHAKKMDISQFDPSCCVGFYIQSEEEYVRCRTTLENSYGWKSQNPAFTFADGSHR